MVLNPFTDTAPFEKDPLKCEIRNPSAFLYSFLHWHVKGFSLKRITLKVNALQDRKRYCLEASPYIFSPEILQAGAVKGLTSTETIRLITDGEKRGGTFRWGEGRLYTYCYTVTTRMTSALRWTAMRAILMFH